jgi:hypothetical protein
MATWSVKTRFSRGRGLTAANCFFGIRFIWFIESFVIWAPTAALRQSIGGSVKEQKSRKMRPGTISSSND